MRHGGALALACPVRLWCWLGDVPQIVDRSRTVGPGPKRGHVPRRAPAGPGLRRRIQLAGMVGA